MKYRVAIIDPVNRSIEYKRVEDGNVARAAGVEKTDHGVVRGAIPSYGNIYGYGIFVYEWGLYSTRPEYFGINGQLYHGKSVLYAFNEAGETVELNLDHPQPEWYGSIDNAEKAIEDGKVARPHTSINGKIYWSWPENAGTKPEQ